MKIETFKYFYPEKPRLINIKQPLINILSDDKNWVAERKYNGSRLQLHYIGGEFQFWGRHGEKLQYAPSPEVKEALAALPLSGYCLFDGELRHHKSVGVRHKIMIYDVFIWQGTLLISKPFWYRRNILTKMLPVNGSPVGIPEQFTNEFRQVFREVIKDDEIEGLVIKNLQGKLDLGRKHGIDSKWMYKVRKPSGRYHF